MVISKVWTTGSSSGAALAFDSGLWKIATRRSLTRAADDLRLCLFTMARKSMVSHLFTL